MITRDMLQMSDADLTTKEGQFLQAYNDLQTCIVQMSNAVQTTEGQWKGLGADAYRQGFNELKNHAIALFAELLQRYNKVLVQVHNGIVIMDGEEAKFATEISQQLNR